MTFPVTFIPYINIVLLIVLILFALRAYYKGFLILFLETVSLFVALILAGLLAKPLALALPLDFVDNVLLSIPLIGPLFSTQISTIIWFIILFIIISLILWLIRPLFHIIGKIPVLKGINRILGLGFGLIQAFILFWILSLILLTPLIKNGQDVIQNSAMKYYSDLTNIVLVNTDIKEMSIVKALTNASLDDEDRNNISVWLDNSSVESPEKEVVYKILVKDNLTNQDIEVLQAWLSEYKIDQAKINELIERFK
jgi:uncharacterized membrane protein required for colicin V production